MQAISLQRVGQKELEESVDDIGSGYMKPNHGGLCSNRE